MAAIATIAPSVHSPLKFFGLLEQPFAVTPDPAYLFLGAGHDRALRALCAGMATAFHVEIEADIRDTFSVLVNQEEQSRVVEQVARTIVDPANVFTRAKPKMGSEDFADMMQAVPGAYFWIGHDGSVPVHNPGYVLDDKILPIGASVFARIIETRLPAGSHA